MAKNIDEVKSFLQKAIEQSESREKYAREIVVDMLDDAKHAMITKRCSADRLFQSGLIGRLVELVDRERHLQVLRAVTEFVESE